MKPTSDHWSYNTNAARELAQRKRSHKRIMSALGIALFAAATNMRVADVPLGAKILTTDPLTLDRTKCTRKRTSPQVDSALSLLD